MAKTVVKNTKAGTVTKDTSKLTGRQKVQVSKAKNRKELSKNATIMSTASTLGAEVASTVQGVARERTKREQARQDTAQKALAKWNSILKSTPDAAEGTNDGMEGTNNQGNNTGTNPDIIWG